MIHRVFVLLSWLSALSPLIPISLIFLRWRFSSFARILLTLLIMSAAVDALSLYFVKVLHRGNIALHCGYTVVELYLVGLIYTQELFYKWGLWWTLAVVTTTTVLFSTNPPLQANFLITVIFQPLLILFSILAFNRALNRLATASLLDDYFFWFNTAVLFYFGVNTFLEIFESLIRFKVNSNETQLLWMIQLVGNTSFNGLLAITVWKERRA